MNAVASSPAWRLAGAFWEICLLKRAPQELPASRFLFNAVAVVFILRGAVINAFSFPIPEALMLNIIMTGLLLLTLFALLYLRSSQARLLQTATAMMGSSIILFPAALALRFWFHVIEQSGSSSQFAGHCWVLLFVWELFIAAHILRHALNARLIAGFFIAIAYVFLEFQVMYIAHDVLAPLFA